jgi:hypothetical protein
MRANHVQLDNLQLLALRGLRLASSVRRRLQATGVYYQPAVSIEHQQNAKRYVLRGVESGGAVAELGAYCSFVAEDGTPLSWLQPVDTVGVNGLHAVVIAPTLVRLQVLRYRQTYDVLITRHALTETAPGKRPRLDNSVLFHGRQGGLALELWGRDAGFRGSVVPLFFTRAGEKLMLPAQFLQALQQITGASCCIGCRHSHVLVPPKAEETVIKEWRQADGRTESKAG